MIYRCTICDHEIKLLGKRSGFQIFRCSNCGLGQTGKPSFQKSDYHRDREYLLEEPLFKNIFQKRVNIISKFLKSGKVLEVGCSTGLMLSLLKEDKWDVMGIEISKDAGEIAKNRGIEVISKRFEDIKFNAKFDVIIFNHTLEHLENPREALEKAYELLYPNGLLYIDVPNFGGLSSKLYGINWPSLLPEEHLWHFTEKSLLILFKGIGFKAIFTERASGIWDYYDPIKGIFISLISFKKRFFKEILTMFPSWFVTKLEIGSDFMVIARKSK